MLKTYELHDKVIKYKYVYNSFIWDPELASRMLFAHLQAASNFHFHSKEELKWPFNLGLYMCSLMLYHYAFYESLTQQLTGSLDLCSQE